jgi:hypothetical protein
VTIPELATEPVLVVVNHQLSTIVEEVDEDCQMLPCVIDHSAIPGQATGNAEPVLSVNYASDTDSSSLWNAAESTDDSMDSVSLGSTDNDLGNLVPHDSVIKSRFMEDVMPVLDNRDPYFSLLS